MECITSQSIFISFLAWQRRACVGRAYPLVATQVIVTQHVAFLFRPWSRLCFLECCFLGTSIRQRGKLRRELCSTKTEMEQRRRAARSLSDPVTAASSGSFPASLQNVSGSRSWLQTASACMASCAACVTRLYEHVNKTPQTGTLCDGSCKA